MARLPNAMSYQPGGYNPYGTLGQRLRYVDQIDHTLEREDTMLGLEFARYVEGLSGDDYRRAIGKLPTALVVEYTDAQRKLWQRGQPSAFDNIARAHGNRGYPPQQSHR